MPKVIKLLQCIVFLPIYCVSFIVPRNRNIWIFGSWGGQKFADNPKYLFLYVKRNHPEIRPILLSHRAKVVKELTRKGYEAYKAFSPKGFLYSLRAGCAVVSHDLQDINCFAIGRARIIELWHGTPLKKMLHDSNLHRENNKLRTKIIDLKDRISPFTLLRCDAFIAASEETKEKLVSAFRGDKDRLHITGYPRNDALFDTEWLTDNQCDYLGGIKNKVAFKYVITYLPTYRNLGKKEIDLFEKYGLKINAAQQMLRRLNAIFLIKAHSGKLNLPTVGKNLGRVYVPSNDELPDIYPLLKETDILITDYSSVYFDYLLLNRPIIFTPFDIEEYTKGNGLYYDYEEVTPGPKARDWPEVFNFIQEALQNDCWKEEREAVCNRFNKFRDAESSKRVFEAIKEMLEGRR